MCQPRRTDWGPGWLVLSPLWEHVAPYFRVEKHGRTPDAGSGAAYFRLEFEPPVRFWRALLHVRVPCVACGVLVAPFRRRVGGGSYYSATCVVSLNLACCRTADARADHACIVEALGGARPSDLQGRLF